MNITFQPIQSLVDRATTRTVSFSVNNAITAESAEQEVKVSDTTGFHIYSDLSLGLGLSAAVNQEKANLYLEVLEDYAQIASEFVRINPNVLMFEVQGERLHLFLNRTPVNEQTLGELFEFATYFTNAVYAKIKPKAGDDWGGFCIAADHGRAIVLSTGRDGDDSLISLGTPANTPAKRLGWTPGVESGHIAVPLEVAIEGGMLQSRNERRVTREWVEFDLLGETVIKARSAYGTLMEQAVTNLRTANRAQMERRLVALSAKSGELMNQGSATVKNPATVQAFYIRADLDGFTRRVDAAFDEANRNPLAYNPALKQLVSEFLQIMQLPDAYESHIHGTVIRLPWAGDCYNAIILPDDGETYEKARTYLPGVASLHWFDPSGEVNKKRAPELAAVARQNDWSIGIAGGQKSQGRLLVANITTCQRQFLVAAGWGSRRSLDAQSADNLCPNEAAIHDEDYSPLDGPFKRAFKEWKEGGPTIYRKATADDLSKAAREQLVTKGSSVQIAPRSVSVVAPSKKPSYG
jgi:hypothetical protein